ARFDLARDAHFGRERHVDEEPTGERDLRGDARSLGTDGFFDDLNELGLTALQFVGDVGRRAAPGTIPGRATPLRDCLAADTPVPVAVLFVRVVRLTVLGVFVLFRFD